jgi:hypothetical protein
MTVFGFTGDCKSCVLLATEALQEERKTCLLTEKCWSIALVSPLVLLPLFHKLTKWSLNFIMCFSIFYWRAKCSRSVSWSHFIWFFFVYQTKLGFGSYLSSLEIIILCHMGYAQSSPFLICIAGSKRTPIIFTYKLLFCRVFRVSVFFF